MFGDPLGGLLFGGETLDYFRRAIGPKNIDHPAKSGITFSRHESGSVFGRICAYGAPVQAPGALGTTGTHANCPMLASVATFFKFDLQEQIPSPRVLSSQLPIA